LNELDHDSRTEYEKMRGENENFIKEIHYTRNELEEMNYKLQNSEEKLRQDALRQRAQHLKEERISLIKKKEELELQTNESNLPFPEARERLLTRIKQDNAEIL